MCNQAMQIEAMEYDSSKILNDDGYYHRPDWYVSETECERLRLDVERMSSDEQDIMLVEQFDTDTIYTHLERI